MSWFGWGQSVEEEAEDERQIREAACVRADISATDEEKEMMKEVRTILEETRSEWTFEGEEEYVFPDMQVLRFVRGNKWVVGKTAHMLVKFVNWRHDNNNLLIKDEDVQVEIDKGFVVSQGNARNGRPIIWVCVQRHDKYERDIDVINKFIIWNVQRAMARTLENDDRFIIVFDLRQNST